jgi:hypothetical protein
VLLARVSNIAMLLSAPLLLIQKKKQLRVASLTISTVFFLVVETKEQLNRGCALFFCPNELKIVSNASLGLLRAPPQA